MKKTILALLLFITVFTNLRGQTVIDENELKFDISIPRNPNPLPSGTLYIRPLRQLV